MKIRLYAPIKKENMYSRQKHAIELYIVMTGKHKNNHLNKYEINIFHVLILMFKVKKNMTPFWNFLNQYTANFVKNILIKTYTIQKLFQKEKMFQFQIEDHFE